MRETKSQGQEGYLYRYITDKNYSALLNFQKTYEAMAYRTWLTLLDSCHGIWLLTVEQVTI
jgi:hypothetical protein